jgi:hypothetical protein
MVRFPSIGKLTAKTPSPPSLEQKTFSGLGVLGAWAVQVDRHAGGV